MTNSVADKIARLRGMKQRAEKIAVLTAYDASFAAIMEDCGIDVVLVGDSLGNVVQGHDSTLPVTMEDMIYHVRNVARVNKDSLLVADMPYQSYTAVDAAVTNAQRLVDAGAHMVKLEGGQKLLPVLEAIRSKHIPICGHLGLLPQSVRELGGYKVQGRDSESAEQMLQDARTLEEAGVDMIVLECIPAELGKQISDAISIPTIGIGAGVDCDGQVLVLYDMLGITRGKRPRFVHNFLAEVDGQVNDKVAAAIKKYIQAVKQGDFPAEAHSYR